MSTPEQLEVLTAFGVSLDSALVVAVKPSEWAELESIDCPHFLLNIADHTANIVETLKQPVADAWQSTNGTAYCTSSNGQILIFRGGVSSKEAVCDREEEFGAIWGFSGSSGIDDTLFIGCDTSLFVRASGSWQEHPMPEQVGMVFGLHGLTPDEVYVCTDAGLLLWDGAGLSEVEGPDDEPTAVLVLSKTEMLVVGDSGLYLWTDNTGWEELESPLEDFAGGIIKWDGDVLIPALDGIARFHDGVLTKESDFSCNSLIDVGNAVLAVGGGEGLFVSSDGQEWSEISLPKVK